MFDVRFYPRTSYIIYIVDLLTLNSQSAALQLMLTKDYLTYFLHKAFHRLALGNKASLQH